VTGLFGGAFDPPHNGHVALAETALRHFELHQLLVLVVVDPGHKGVALGAEDRFRLAELAFGTLPRTEILREEHPRTVDALRAHDFAEPLFLVGADEFVHFLSWKDPDGVLGEARLAVATRPGYPRERFEPVLAGLQRPDRVEFFEIPPVDVSSTTVRERASRGESIAELVPEPVARAIEVAGLYR
jgi:nicotinate-nucleotide adenylyltransferase